MPKTVIDVDVNDETFKNFVEKFNAYRESLANLPGSWGATDDAVRSTGDALSSITQEIEAQNAALRRQADQQAKGQRGPGIGRPGAQPATPAAAQRRASSPQAPQPVILGAAATTPPPFQDRLSAVLSQVLRRPSPQPSQQVGDKAEATLSPAARPPPTQRRAGPSVAVPASPGTAPTADPMAEAARSAKAIRTDFAAMLDGLVDEVARLSGHEPKPKTTFQSLGFLASEPEPSAADVADRGSGAMLEAILSRMEAKGTPQVQLVHPPQRGDEAAPATSAASASPAAPGAPTADFAKGVKDAESIESAFVAANAALTAGLLVLQQMSAEEKRIHDAEEKARKASAEADKKAEKASAQRKKTMDNMVTSSAKVAKTVAGTTMDVLKWASIGTIGGLIGGGGLLFGLDRLAQNTSDKQRTASGLDMSTAGVQAFKVNYDQLVDPDQFLSGVNDALHDVTKQVGLIGAGLNPNALRKDPDTAPVQVLNAIRSIAQRTPDALMGNVLQARHLDQFVSLQDFERLKNETDAQYAKRRENYGKDKTDLYIDPAVLRENQLFSAQLHRAGAMIENTFVRALGPLQGPLTHLSSAFTKAVETFLKSPAIGHVIDDLATNLEHFAKDLDKPETQAKIRKFTDETIPRIVTDLEGFATGLEKVLKFFHLIPDGSPAPAAGSPGSPTDPNDPSAPPDQRHVTPFDSGGHPDLGHVFMPWEHTPAGGNIGDHVVTAANDTLAATKHAAGTAIDFALHQAKRDQARQAGSYFMQQGWTKAQAAGVVANLFSEGVNKKGLLDPNAQGDFNKKTGQYEAYGIGQWHKDRQDEFKKWAGHDIHGSSLAEQLAFVQYELTKGARKYAGDVLKKTKGSHEAGSVVSRLYESPKNVNQEALKRGNDAQVVVTILNNTGGNSTATANQASK